MTIKLSTMAKWCFYIVFLWCVICQGFLSSSAQDNINHGKVDICSNATTSGNTVHLFRNKTTEPGRVCECTAVIAEPDCMNVSFSNKLNKTKPHSCEYFHEVPYPGIDPNCTIQSLRDEQNCTNNVTFRFKGAKLHGDIMTISASRKINVTCKMMHKSALEWSRECNVSNVLKPKTSVICSQKTTGDKPALPEVLNCTTRITVTNIYVGVKGSNRTACGDNGTFTGYDGNCCQREPEDVLFNAHCLETLQDIPEKKKYQTFMASVYGCDDRAVCRVNSSVLPVGKNTLTRRYSSSYIIVEYECPGHNSKTTASLVEGMNVDEDTDGDKQLGGTTTAKQDVSMNVVENTNREKQEPGEQLPTYVIAAVAAVGVLIIAVAIVTVTDCVRKKRSNANKHVYMTVERTTGQELQTLSTRNVTNGPNRGDCFEDIPLESDNELDPLYDQADQQDTHNGGHDDKTRGTNSDDVYDHTNNVRGTHVPTMATGVKREDEEDTYDHAGDSRKRKKAGAKLKLTGSGEEDPIDHRGGPAGGQKDQIEGGVYGKLNHGDAVYDHATRQSMKSPSNTNCVSITYGRLNMNVEEDSDVYNHTTAGKKKPTVIDEPYSTLKEA